MPGTQWTLNNVTSFPTAVAIEVTCNSHFLFGNFLIPRRPAPDSGKLPPPCSILHGVRAWGRAHGQCPGQCTGVGAQLHELSAVVATYTSWGPVSGCFQAVWLVIPLWHFCLCVLTCNTSSITTQRAGKWVFMESSCCSQPHLPFGTVSQATFSSHAGTNVLTLAS